MTRKKLSKLLMGGAAKQGFHPVVGQTYGAFLHLYKRVTNGLILSLGIQSSWHFGESFTGAYYLSPTFTWGYMPPSFPLAAYARIGTFLNSEERIRLLSAEYAKSGIVDAWWSPFSEDNALRFCEALEVTESRFLGQAGLVEAVSDLAVVKQHMALIRATIEFARAEMPSEAAQDIPLSTLESSALLALKKLDPQRANKHFPPFLALDVFRWLQHGGTP